MTLYITPSGRIIRRSNWAKPSHSADAADNNVNVLVPINVRAEEDDYVVTALVPGVKADELSIQIHNEVLTIQGELKEESKENEKFLLREMPVGRFYRTIRLPEKLDSTKAVAELNDGVLTLRVTKAEDARPKTIKVSMN